MARTRPLARALPLAALLAALLAVASAATTLRSLSVRELLERAELVFEGRALAREARELRPGGAIRTCVRFEVLEIVKGPAVASPLELCFSGGTVGARTRLVHGVDAPEPGERGVYFVEDLAAPRVHPLAGFDQGRFPVRGEGAAAEVTSADGRPVTALDAGAPAAAGPSDGVARGAQLGAADARGLSPAAFKARLRDLLAEASP
jgi:hypothetical protein